MKGIIIKKRDLLNFLLYLLIFIILFRIPFLTAKFPKIGAIYNLGSIFCAFVALFLLIRSKNFSKFELLIVIFCGIMILSTVINNGDIVQSISTSIPIIAYALIIRFGLKYNTKVFLNSFEFFLYSIVFMNFISIILFPEGLYASNSISFYTTNNWLLGFKNNHIVYIIPALLISIINSYYTIERLKIRTILLIIISLYTTIAVKSSTSLVGLIIILILIFFINGKNKIITNVRVFLWTYIVLFFSIVIFRLQELFRFLIVDILHKDITLTNRIYIWDYIIEFIKNKPIIGYGIEDINVRYFKTFEYQSFHAHNQILEIIYQVGFIGFIIFCAIFYLSYRELVKNNKKYISKTISIVLFAFFIMTLTEAYSLQYIFLIMIFGYNIKSLLKESESNEN